MCWSVLSFVLDWFVKGWMFSVCISQRLWRRTVESSLFYRFDWLIWLSSLFVLEPDFPLSSLPENPFQSWNQRIKRLQRALHKSICIKRKLTLNTFFTSTNEIASDRTKWGNSLCFLKRGNLAIHHFLRFGCCVGLKGREGNFLRAYLWDVAKKIESTSMICYCII